MNKAACPLCGDPHPLFVKDEAELEEDPAPFPECEHWIGRCDTDGGCHWDRDAYVDMVNSGLDPEEALYSGSLVLLNGLDLPPLVNEDQEWPERDILEEIFGDHLPLAEAAYEKWHRPGNAGRIFDAMATSLGVETVEIWGGTSPMDSWITYEHYVPGRDDVLTRLRAAVVQKPAVDPVESRIVVGQPNSGSRLSHRSATEEIVCWLANVALKQLNGALLRADYLTTVDGFRECPNAAGRQHRPFELAHFVSSPRFTLDGLPTTTEMPL